MSRWFVRQVRFGLLLLIIGPLGCLGVPRLPDDNTSGEEKKVAREQVDLPPEESAKICLNAARQLEKKGGEEEAISLYEKARITDPRQEQVARQLAVLYDRQGCFSRALEEYQKALQLTPKDPDLLNDLGYSYYNHGQLAEAEEYLRHALAISPKHPRANINLGLVLGEQQKYEESMEAFMRVVPEAQAHCNLAFVLSTQGKREEAMQEYREALRLDHTLVRARETLDKLRRARPAATPGQATAQAPPSERERFGETSGAKLGDAPPLPVGEVAQVCPEPPQRPQAKQQEVAGADR